MTDFSDPDPDEPEEDEPHPKDGAELTSDVAFPVMHFSWNVRPVRRSRFAPLPKELEQENPEKSKSPYWLKEDPSVRELQSKPVDCCVLHSLLVFAGHEKELEPPKVAEATWSVDARATTVDSVDLMLGCVDVFVCLLVAENCLSTKVGL